MTATAAGPPIEIPESFRTERLLVRAPRPGDGRELNAAALETLDELVPWMPWVHPFPTIAQSEEGCLRSMDRWRDRSDLRLHLYRLEDGAFVGGSGLHRIDWTVPKFEIGYWRRKRYQGMGYVTEAVRGITRFAFDVLHARRVEIRCDSQNERSRAVMVRSGYTYEGTLRNNGIRADGRLGDTLVYSLVSAEYEEWKKP